MLFYVNTLQFFPAAVYLGEGIHNLQNISQFLQIVFLVELLNLFVQLAGSTIPIFCIVKNPDIGLLSLLCYEIRNQISD